MHFSQISQRIKYYANSAHPMWSKDPVCDHRFPTSSGPSSRKVSEVGGAVLTSRTMADDPVHPLDREGAREFTSAGSGDLGYLGCIIPTWH